MASGLSCATTRGMASATMRGMVSATMRGMALALAACAVAFPGAASAQERAAARARARELGVAPGIFRPGGLNAITDVAGVRVGQATVIEGDSVRTGVTAILPHGGNPFLDRVPAAIHVGNGFGKLLGVTQVRELGELETPILLTCTLCVWKAADAMVEWMLQRPGMEGVGSINPVVGETNDGVLNAIRSRPIRPEHVRAALEGASAGAVAEGAVGAGAGTVAFGWKGGIGTSSRVLPRSLGGYTVGVLVQSNFGGVLQVMGAPVGEALGRYAFKDDVDRERGDGSIMMVVATDAPLLDRNLERLAARAIMGLSRTGSSASNGSGDYVIAFSTAASVRRHLPAPRDTSRAASFRVSEELVNDATSALFQAVVEATEEAIYNSLFAATSVRSNARTVEALPLDEVRRILQQHGIRPR
ncbi:MAG: D-aminopeptidase [Gemmatimonadota bacterium]